MTLNLEQPSMIPQKLQYVGSLLAWPYHKLFPKSENAYLVVLVFSIAYISAFSAVALYFTRRLTIDLSLSPTTRARSANSRHNRIDLSRSSRHADAAVCNAVGSQVINVSLGSGLPWLVYTLIHGTIWIPFTSETLVWKALALVIGAYLMLNFNFRSSLCLLARHLTITSSASRKLTELSCSRSSFVG
ncbi:hypothetical protein AC1031_007060 [Aphanomyces cochlioides]|nr:hypothetical protein AC1031_007060 [Aphanomyces cochlioides]